MSSVGVQFVGGPADGTLSVIQGDPMNPPRVYDQMVSAATGRQLVYRREVNPGDDGPLWHYVYDDSPTA